MKTKVRKTDENKNENSTTLAVAHIAKPAEDVKNAPEVTPTNEATETDSPNEEAKQNLLLAKIEKFKPEPPTAEGRIQRMKEFQQLSVRFQQLQDKYNDFKMFEAGNDKTAAKVSFKNAQGFEFKVENPTVIEILKNAALHELKILLEETRHEILTFEF